MASWAIFSICYFMELIYFIINVYVFTTVAPADAPATSVDFLCMHIYFIMYFVFWQKGLFGYLSYNIYVSIIEWPLSGAQTRWAEGPEIFRLRRGKLSLSIYFYLQHLNKNGNFWVKFKFFMFQVYLNHDMSSIGKIYFEKIIAPPLFIFAKKIKIIR